MTAYRKWRLRSTDTSIAGEYMAATEIELRETAGGVDATASGGTATASAINGAGWSADKAFDNNMSLFWTTGGNAPPAGGHWIQWDFGPGNEKDINQVVYTSRNDGIREDPLNLYVEFQDPSTGVWITKWIESPIAAWSSAQTRTFTFTPTANLNITKQAAYGVLLAPTNYVSLSKQAAYAVMLSNEAKIAKQAAYAVMLTAEAKVAKMAAYVVILPQTRSRRVSLM